MADTLAQAANDKLNAATQAKTDADTALGAAQTAAVAAQKDVDTATGQLKGLNDDVAGIRRQIAETTVEADGEALFAQLQDKFVAIRAKQKELTGLQEQADEKQRAVAVAQDAATRATGTKTAADAAKKDADKRETTITKWRTDATTAPLSGLPVAADVSLAGPIKDAADAALAELGTMGLPAELIDLAGKRRRYEQGRLDAVDAQSRAAERHRAQVGSAAGLTGVTEQKRVDFEQQMDDLGNFAVNGIARRDRALTLLAGVSASSDLGDAEKQKLTAMNNTAKDVDGNGADAFAAVTDVIAKQTSVDEQSDKIQGELADALAADPTSNPQPPPADQTELDNRNQALQTSQGNVTGAMTTALANLDDAVPDSAWGVLDDYEEALAILAGLAAADPNALADPAKEKAYVDAIVAEGTNATEVDDFAAKERTAADRAAATATTRSARLLQALRSDD